MKVLKEEEKINYDKYEIRGYLNEIIDSNEIIIILKTDLGDVIYYIDKNLPDPQLTRARIKIKPIKVLTIKEKKELLKMCGLYLTAKAMYEIKYEGKPPVSV